MSITSDLAWHNGRVKNREEAAPSVASISLHMAIAVFDGMMAYWNGDHYNPHRFREHFDRFRVNSARMELEFPWTTAELTEGAAALLERLPRRDWYVRPIAYRPQPEIFLTGTHGSPVDVCIFCVEASPGNFAELRCHLSPVPRVSGDAMPVAAKVAGVYVNSFRCRRQAEEEGFQDGIMLDPAGNIAEASAANVFFIGGGRLVTPPADGSVFPGITRACVLEIAAELGIPCEERPVAPAEAAAFEGAFLASTLMELKPLACLGDIAYGTGAHPLFARIRDRFIGMTRQ